MGPNSVFSMTGVLIKPGLRHTGNPPKNTAKAASQGLRVASCWGWYGDSFFPTASRENPGDTLVLDAWPPTLGDNMFGLFKHLLLDVLLQGSKKNYCCGSGAERLAWYYPESLLGPGECGLD